MFVRVVVMLFCVVLVCECVGYSLEIMVVFVLGFVLMVVCMLVLLVFMIMMLNWW